MRSGHDLLFPDGVAFPSSAAEVRELLSYASKSGVRVVPYGGGTSVVGHLNRTDSHTPVLVIDLSRLNNLQELDTSNQLATFGAGVTGPDLEAQLRAHGYTLGHFPQSFELSTLGGWIVTRSSGQQSIYYGRIEKLFAGGSVETPAGHLEISSFPASAAGTDLREVVLGSEGRLGIISSATVRITPLPTREFFRGVFFPDFETGRQAAQQLAQARLPLSMLRLSNAVETATTLALGSHAQATQVLERILSMRGLGSEKCLLLFGISSNSAALASLTYRETMHLIQRKGGVMLGPLGAELGKQWRKSRFRNPYLRNTLWEKGYAIDTLETATNWTNVPTLLNAIELALREGLAASGERVHVFTHLSHLYPQGSSIYTTYLYRRATDPDETLQRWQLLKAAASSAIVAHGGTISHQHGVGFDHAPYLAAEKGQLGIEAIRALQHQFDPAQIMNPGKTLLA
jgi:alkyldihydroxyacetonephosphate synthase